MTALSDLLRDRSIIVCCGTGGVGKTTLAAALAIEGARLGRRTVVVTIDPARRLADALGLDALSNTPTRVPVDGDLSAVMLDVRATFDSVVSRYADPPEQADRILANRFYRNIAGRLSGTQEYMAAEKLYELHDESGFDLVVVDTPPSRNALDFLDAPNRLTRFLDHRLYRVLTAPSRGVLRPVNLAAQTFLKTVAKIVGASVIDDAITFFQAFDGMEQGFRDRAERVMRLLRSETTSFVLIASPQRDTVVEAGYFAERLAADGIDVDALIVNKMHPRFSSTGSSVELRTRAEAAEGALRGLMENLADFVSVAEREEASLADLVVALPGSTIVRVPLLVDDVSDLEGLTDLTRHLMAG